jgi:hypothetical protein
MKPRRSLFLPDAKAEVGFTETQPPPALGIVAGSAQELGEESSERFGGAPAENTGVERTQYRIVLHMGIKGDSELVTAVPSAKCMIQSVLAIT